MSWRTRYDNFRLNTTGFLSHLPGQRIPLSAGRWPTREDMVRYFDSYVQRQNIALELGCEVKGIDRAADGWVINTSSGEIDTRAIILATGNYRTPSLPDWPGLKDFTGQLVHSGDFRNAWPFRDREVLVVGAGNSGADIAVQLANAGARRIWLAVRTPPHYPKGHRYIADNMWTSASAEELLPGIRRIIETMPPHPSHFIMTGWKADPNRPDMAFSVEDEIYMALYTVWQDPADDERYCDWAASNMAAMSHLATGTALADENLGRRPARFITESNMARLDKVRSTYDPNNRFHSWMGRP